MRLLTEISNVRYGILEAVDLAEAADLFGEVFSRFEPLATSAGMTSAELSEYVFVFGSKVIAEELAIIARDPSGQMVGMMFSDDLGTPPPDLDALSESFAPVGALLESLTHQYLDSHAVNAGSHVQMMLLAVLPDFSSNGIAQNLVRICIENACKRGYRFAITEATGLVSQHIFRKLGFQDQFVAVYRDFRFDGKAVFAAFESIGGTILMEVRFEPPVGSQTK